MPKKKEFNVFISHYHKDQEELRKLKDLLSRNGYKIKDSSIDESKPNEAKNPDYIKSLLRPRIDWAGAIIVLIGSETHTRKWVDWEIEYAQRKDKRIVGVFIQGAKDSDVPKNLDKFGDSLVGWNSGKVIDAINGKNNDFDCPDGTPRKNRWDMVRTTC